MYLVEKLENMVRAENLTNLGISNLPPKYILLNFYSGIGTITSVRVNAKGTHVSILANVPVKGNRKF